MALHHRIAHPDSCLLAIDLDGTLLDSTNQIPKDNQNALAACSKAGVVIAIVTGRRFTAARTFLSKLSIDPFIVANSGAIIMKSEKGPLLKRHLLSRKVAYKIMKLAEEKNIVPIIHDGPEGESHLVLSKKAKNIPHIAQYLRHVVPPPIWVSSIRLDRDPVQIGFVSTTSNIRKLECRLHQELNKERKTISLARTEYLTRNFALLDALAINATKSTALSFLRNHVRPSISHTIAIGDNWNDLDMLRTAGMGIIMANADRKLRTMGFTETSSNDQAGVAQAIERYIINWRNDSSLKPEQ